MSARAYDLRAALAAFDRNRFGSLQAILDALRALLVARPREEWGEDHGEVLWWRFPVVEAPYVGSPLDTDWPGDTPGLELTHWTPITVPEPPA